MAHSIATTLALTVSLAGAGSAWPEASAPPIFDGRWAILLVKETGLCKPAETYAFLVAERGRFSPSGTGGGAPELKAAGVPRGF